MAERGATRKGSGARKAATKKAPAAKKSAAASVSSTDVNMGHVFALRPRVSTAFRQEDFLAARRFLEEESYATVDEAARAFAERALGVSNDPSEKRGGKRGR